MYYNICDYGAIADGITDNTKAIQQAINECAAVGGGMVVVPNGNFMTYTLYLKSGVRLELSAGATLTGGTDSHLYPEIADNDYWQPGHCSRLNRRTLIYAENAENFAITGRGRIDGNGEAFMHTDDKIYELHCHWKRKHDTLIPGRAILFVACRDVLLEDFSVINSAGWTLWILDCDRVQLHRMRIDCDFRIPNVDGIHISASRDIAVSDCFIRSSDDALVLRSHQEQLYSSRPCERVTITNCTLKSGSSAIRLGWTHDYEIRDCSFSDLMIEQSFCGIDVYIPALAAIQKDPPRGPGAPTPPPVKPFKVKNIHFDNIIMEVETCFMKIDLGPNLPIDSVENLVFSNITATCGCYPFIKSMPEYQVKSIVFQNVNMELKEPVRRDLSNYSAYQPTMAFNYAEDIQFDNFRIRRAITPVMPSEI